MDTVKTYSAGVLTPTEFKVQPLVVTTKRPVRS